MSALDEISLSAVISTVNGDLELEDEANGYKLHSDSLAQAAVTHRTVTANSPWLEGTYVTDSVRDNTTEALVVWVIGPTHFLWRSRMQALTDALDQLSYTIAVTIDDAVMGWVCPTPADYTIETQQEYIHATRGVVRAQVMRLPQVSLTRIPFIGAGFWPSVFLAHALGRDVPINFQDPELSAGAVALGELLPT